ncbi:hypothetical protein [Kitasatospora sp. NPDC093558]|uniref:hypothetical protein n=1 Tax=Kitasatospora sp. NPDC093558 TaxID=3155201 RepID=UPI003423FD09
MRPAPTDTDAWYAYRVEGNARQARKRVSAEVILRDQTGSGYIGRKLEGVKVRLAPLMADRRASVLHQQISALESAV